MTATNKKKLTTILGYSLGGLVGSALVLLLVHAARRRWRRDSERWPNLPGEAELHL